MGYGPVQGVAANPHRFQEIDDPDALVDTGQVYTNDIGGRTELMYQDDTGAEVQITETGGLKVPAGVTTFLGLSDTPAGFVANRIVHVNAAGNALLVSSEINVLSGGELLLGDTGLVGSERVLFRKDQDAETRILVDNDNNGVTAQSTFNALVGTAGNLVSVIVGATSTGFTPSLGREPDSAYLMAASSASQLQLITVGSLPILFSPNQNEAGRALSGGGLAWGRETLVNANDIAAFSKDVNAAVQFIVTNPNVGNSVSSTLSCQSNSGLRMFISMFGSGHATSANVGRLVYTGTTELQINASAAAPITFLTTGAERARFLKDANTLQGNAGLKVEGGAGVHVLTLSGGASAASSIAIGIATEKIAAFGATPVIQPTGIAVSAAGIHAALVSLGWITA